MLQIVAVGFPVLAFVGAFVGVSGTRSGAFAAKSRVDVVFAGLDAAVGLLVARALLPWGAPIPVALWLVPVAALAVGTALVVIRWHSWPTLRPGRSIRLSAALAVVHALVLTAIAVLVSGIL